MDKPLTEADVHARWARITDDGIAAHLAGSLEGDASSSLGRKASTPLNGRPAFGRPGIKPFDDDDYDVQQDRLEGLG